MIATMFIARNLIERSYNERDSLALKSAHDRMLLCAWESSQLSDATLKEQWHRLAAFALHARKTVYYEESIKQEVAGEAREKTLAHYHERLDAHHGGLARAAQDVALLLIE